MKRTTKSTQPSGNRQLSLFETSDNPFEHIKHIDEQGQEYWLAREMMTVMEYLEWRNFTPVIERAKVACEKGGAEPNYHFVDQHELITVGKGARRRAASFKLSRLACYYTAMNGDPNKKWVAYAQTYFVVQTRKQELAEEKQHKQIPARQSKEYRALIDSGYNDEQAIQRIKSREYSKDRFSLVTGVWHGHGGDIGKLADHSTYRATGKHVWQWKEEWHIKVSPRNYFSTAMLNILSMVEFLAANLSIGRNSRGTEALAKDIDTATSYVDIAGLQRDYPEMFVRPPLPKLEQPRLTRGDYLEG